MNSIFIRFRRASGGMGMLLLMLGGNAFRVSANPVPVANNPVSQGAATISGSGTPQVTINQISANAFINWTSFNIAAGENTTFNQPSSSSVTWNYINDPNAPAASIINGSISANGYVVLQNPNGFTVGGSAAITAHGLVMTTASTPALNLSSGGPWSFNTPPPTANIINYGQINITGGGSAFLIAANIENGIDPVTQKPGTISAPGGNIGLYAGQMVLVSMSPDGRGLSAQVTLPQGSVDNQGNLIADGGSIAAQAQMVNQNGLIQANSAQNVNGTIELVAGDPGNASDPVNAGAAINLGADSVISANGDSTAPALSSGGSVTIQSGNSFSDQSGSGINVAGAAQGGNGGEVTIAAPQMSAINSTIDASAATGYPNGSLSVNTAKITLNADGSPVAGALALNVNSLSVGFSQINLQASGGLELAAPWTLAAQAAPVSLTLSSGNNITVDNGSGISAGKNWTVNLNAGGELDFLGASPTTFADNLNLAVQSMTSADGNINFQALDDIETISVILPDFNSAAALNFSAGNSIFLNGSLSAGLNWDVNMMAGTQLTSKSQITPGNDGIYLNGDAYIQAVNGDANHNAINLYAANEILVDSGAIRTVGGGNIDVTTEYGNVNSGTGANGFNYLPTAPYYMPSPLLSGISTAAGGNVTINAGGDVVSFSAEQVVSGTSMWPDPGTGAFGSAPGNVTITAGGSVYGHFVEVNGTGTINAGHDIGIAPSLSNPNVVERDVALSLVKGSWNLNAGWDPDTQSVQSGVGDIFLQEVRNPNGVFNDSTTTSGRRTVPAAGNHLFDYDPQALVSLTAGDGVYLTGYELPRPSYALNVQPVPMLLPPILIINAGPGGVSLQSPTAIADSGLNTLITLLDQDITLFPSPYQNFEITTMDGGSLYGNDARLVMSDSGYTQWFVSNSGIQPFSENDHASVPALLNNYQPATINLAGSMENLVLQTDKATQIHVAGDMTGCSFFGENLHSSDVTSINVGGQIYNAGSFTSVTLDQPLPTVPAADLPLAAPSGTSLSSWYLALVLAVNPALLPTQSLSSVNPSQLGSYLSFAHLFPGLSIGQALAYDPATGRLTAVGPLDPGLFNALETQTLTLVRYGPNGYPLLDANGHFVLDTITWAPGGSANAALISSLYNDSQKASPFGGAPPGAYVVGGTGQFNVTAGSISLGNSAGIISAGNGGTPNTQFLSHSYSFLAPYITSGANINVTVLDPQQTVNGLTEPSLYMPASAIASLGGGDVNVSAPNGSIDLGSQELLSFETQIMNVSHIGLGVYAAASGNVSVTALGNINIDSSRIATFDGGNVFVESYGGDVNAGSGGTVAIPIDYFTPGFSDFPLEVIPANGIVAGTLTAAQPVPTGAARLPGNITVITPQGSIYADLGGISQAAFGETLTAAATSTIGLFAGTPLDFNNDWYSEDNNWNAKPPLYIGNIILGSSGVIGVNVVAKATGTITGLIISQQNADINAAGSFAGTVLSGGKATLSSGGTISGTIVAIGGVSTSGGGNLTATVLSTSVNGGAGTLATASSASSTGQSAAGQTSTETQKQVASNASGNDDDKKGNKTGLARTVGRVTVILPKAG